MLGVPVPIRSVGSTWSLEVSATSVRAEPVEASISSSRIERAPRGRRSRYAFEPSSFHQS